jgi:hypothetical protein
MTDAPSGPARKSPAALDIADLAKLLRSSGSRHASEAAIRADIDAGAPANADGTINLVHYGAWLARQVTASEAARGN